MLFFSILCAVQNFLKTRNFLKNHISDVWSDSTKRSEKLIKHTHEIEQISYKETKPIRGSGVTVGVGAGGRVSPDTSHWDISADLPGKERQGKIGKMEKKKKENQKREDEILEMEGGKVTKWGERTFYFYFFAFHFSKPLKFVLGVPKWEFSNGKKDSRREKKSGKMTLMPPLKNIPLTPLMRGEVLIEPNFDKLHKPSFESLSKHVSKSDARDVNMQ